MKIGILLAGHTPDVLARDHGSFDDQFARLLDGRGFRFTTYRVVDGDFPTSELDQDGWLITGSRHGTYEDHSWIPPLEDLIRRIYRADRPLVGVCFGHQIIAQALGGVCEKFAGGWSIGHQSYRMADGSERAVMAWHQDQVTTAPPGARCVGSSAFCQNAFLLYGTRAYTMQPHPEFDQSFIEAMLIHRRETVPTPLAEAADQTVARPLDTARCADEIAQFLTHRRVRDDQVTQ